MIGQKNNLEILRKWRMNRAFPRFIIIVGDRGSGRYTLSKEIISLLNATEYISETGIDSIRDVIRNAYTLSENTVYIFRDCDDMSLAAKNSLLKVVEEPPNKARFIMTVQDTANVLPTIISRATVLYMSPYTEDELNLTTRASNIAYMIKSVADNTDERISAFFVATELCENVINSIIKKSMLSTLKYLNKLQAKSDGEGVDPELFIRAFKYQIREAPVELQSISVPYITKCCGELKRVATNKKASVETMCINIIEEYKHYGETEV